jgi:hypothetical protein
VFCIIVAVGASASVHRVSATTCFLFSVMMLYSLNKISQQVRFLMIDLTLCDDAVYTR